jgi:hypothetical protein
MSVVSPIDRRKMERRWKHQHSQEQTTCETDGVSAVLLLNRIEKNGKQHVSQLQDQLGAVESECR